jgi:hypothetical protein
MLRPSLSCIVCLGSLCSYVKGFPVSDPGGAAGDSFGNAVALNDDGSILAVGSTGAKSAYVYTCTPSSCARASTVTDPLGQSSDFFGFAVSISGDGRTLAIGAYGSGYVYTYSCNSVGVCGAYNALSDPARSTSNQDYFGWSVSLSGNGEL